MISAADFRQHALPLLEAPAFIAAARLVLDDAGYREAAALVWSEAVRLGGAELPDDALLRLRSWVAAMLKRECDAIRGRMDEIEAQAWLDPVAHYDGLSDDPAVRWTFAAICPEYRRALTKRTRQHRGSDALPG